MRSLVENAEPNASVHDSSESFRSNASKLVRKYFDSMVDQQLTEFYEAPIPTVLFNEESQALEVVEGAEVVENALMKLWFVADTRAQAEKDDYQSAGSIASYDVIRKSHRRIHNSKPARIFTVITANNEDSPYEKMRTLRRTPDGKEIYGGYGINYAAEVFMGAVILSEPEFSAANPDSDVQDIVKNAFIRR